MKSRFLIVALAFVCIIGCSSISIPNYIPDQNPYKQIFFGAFDEVLNATNETLDDLGWVIQSQAEPATFERSALADPNMQQILIFTEVRQTALIVGSRYSRMNIFLREQEDNQVEVEIRYVTVSSTAVKTFRDYRQDQVAKNVFSKIQYRLSK